MSRESERLKSLGRLNYKDMNEGEFYVDARAPTAAAEDAEESSVSGVQAASTWATSKTGANGPGNTDGSDDSSSMQPASLSGGEDDVSGEAQTEAELDKLLRDSELKAKQLEDSLRYREKVLRIKRQQAENARLEAELRKINNECLTLGPTSSDGTNTSVGGNSGTKGAGLHNNTNFISSPFVDRSAPRSHNTATGSQCGDQVAVQGVLAGKAKRGESIPALRVHVSAVSSSSDSDSTFSLACRDSKRGKRKVKPIERTTSGISEINIDSVSARQKYPQSALQYEHMWGWSGKEVDYFNLTFGLFMAGELEIVLGGHMSNRESVLRLERLRTTAYRSQYITWEKLLYLYAAVIRKIEVGAATWESDFGMVERMVLENPGAVDWGARLGAKISQTNKGLQGASQSKIKKRGGAASREAPKVWWCRLYQTGACDRVAPHSKVIRGVR